jgi:hypothetical protein
MIWLSGVHPDVAHPEGLLEGINEAGVTVLVSPDTKGNLCRATPTVRILFVASGDAPGASGRNGARAEGLRAREDGEHIYTAKEPAQLLDFTLDHVRHMLQVGAP